MSRAPHGLAGLDGSAFAALSFDVYGTILDWEPEISAFFQRWIEAESRAFDLDDLLDRYDRLRQPIQSGTPYLPYPEILERTLVALSEEIGVPVGRAQRERFAGLAATHKPFPDSVAALARMRDLGFTLAALSNIDEASFAQAMQAAGISFDVVVTAERVRAYKPSEAHFHTALADLGARGIPRSQVLHIAQSLRADIVPARRIGITSVWLHRPGHVFGRRGSGAETAEPDFETDSLESLATHLAATRSSAQARTR